MARSKSTYQTPEIEEVVEEINETEETDYVEEIEETVEEPVAEEPAKIKHDPILIPRDGSVITRKAPTIESRHIVGKLSPGYSYKINKVVHSAIYGDFYLLENGLYVTKVGNFIIKE